ncbi:hypothetical protein GCM10018952_48170 [Streptosporangium vulgare]
MTPMSARTQTLHLTQALAHAVAQVHGSVPRVTVTVVPMPPPVAVIALGVAVARVDEVGAGVDQARRDGRAEVLHVLAVTVSPRS